MPRSPAPRITGGSWSAWASPCRGESSGGWQFTQRAWVSTRLTSTNIACDRSVASLIDANCAGPSSWPLAAWVGAEGGATAGEAGGRLEQAASRSANAETTAGPSAETRTPRDADARVDACTARSMSPPVAPQGVCARMSAIAPDHLDRSPPVAPQEVRARMSAIAPDHLDHRIAPEPVLGLQVVRVLAGERREVRAVVDDQPLG